MVMINLRIYYPALYRQDVFCEVPEQVKLLLDELKRYEHAQNERRDTMVHTGHSWRRLPNRSCSCHP